MWCLSVLPFRGQSTLAIVFCPCCFRSSLFRQRRRSAGLPLVLFPFHFFASLFTSLFFHSSHLPLPSSFPPSLLLFSLLLLLSITLPFLHFVHHTHPSLTHSPSPFLSLTINTLQQNTMDEAESNAPQQAIVLTIRPSSGSTFTTAISTDSTVLQLKEKLATADLPAASIRLVYSGRVLKDDDQLSVYCKRSLYTH